MSELSWLVRAPAWQLSQVTNWCCAWSNFACGKKRAVIFDGATLGNVALSVARFAEVVFCGAATCCAWSGAKFSA